MSTDRELLEFAAKAAGYKIIAHANDRGFWIHGMGDEWNPLSDDGDALRLSANLHIDVEQNLCHITARYWISDDGGLVSKCVSVDVQGDRISATRLAIVRAAAEIGRAMP